MAQPAAAPETAPWKVQREREREQHRRWMRRWRSRPEHRAASETYQWAHEGLVALEAGIADSVHRAAVCEAAGDSEGARALLEQAEKFRAALETHRESTAACRKVAARTRRHAEPPGHAAKRLSTTPQRRTSTRQREHRSASSRRTATATSGTSSGDPDEPGEGPQPARYCRCDRPVPHRWPDDGQLVCVKCGRQVAP